ncbi:cadherin-like domain-containing protein [Agrobacterium tumefaciens]|nr:BapA/Bap/LapF family large adhesin [Agrobacterium tumefaciens]MCW8060411.1 cadherin-like domain-containing protein [Agrobacterium tumefaciens]MCW8146035.1 cadherin-like domain-containing protein [Agrobacterium tumefaciens]
MTSVGQDGIIDFAWIVGSNSATVSLGDLPAGEYRVVGRATGINFLTSTTVSAEVDLYDHSTVGGYEPGTVSGNVIDENDTVTPTTEVTEVNGIAVGGAGTTPIVGTYGTLTIDAEGNYTYTPNADGAGIGQVDVFEYTITDADGNTDTATLYVRIDSEGQGLVWPADPTLPAEIEMVANDDNGSAVIDSTYQTEADVNGSDSGSIPGTINPIGTTTVTVEETFVVGANRQVDITINASSSDRGELILTLTGPDGAIHTVTANPIIGSPSASFSWADLPEGTYTITAEYSRFGVGGTGTVDLSFNGTTTYLDEYVVADTDPAEGNVLTDDTLGSSYTMFKIDTGDGTFIEVTNGTIVNGEYGTLTINADGSYSYAPNPDLLGIGGTDQFTYRLEHPNGTVEDATLSVSIGHGDGPYVPPVEVSAFGFGDAFDDVIALDHLDDGNSDVDASSIEFPESSLSDNFVLDDGEETDLSASLDAFLDEAEQPENDPSFADHDDQETETSPHTPALEGEVDAFAYLQTSSVDDPEQSLSTHQSVM